MGGGPERAEDFACRASNEEVFGTRRFSCGTWRVLVRFAGRLVRDMKNPQPFFWPPGQACFPSWPGLAWPPGLASWPGPGEARREGTYIGGGPERAEDFACRARNEEVFGTGRCRHDTWRDLMRFAPRFSRDIENPQSFLALPFYSSLALSLIHI